MIARSAAIDELKLCHSEKYINHVKKFCEDGGGYLDADTYTNEYSYEAAVIAVGGLIDLVKQVIDGKLKNGFALLRPPGHHAERDRAMGFCFYNNIAVGALHALQQHGLAQAERRHAVRGIGRGQVRGDADEILKHGSSEGPGPCRLARPATDLAEIPMIRMI